MNFQEISDLLQTTGGWGVATLLIGAIYFLVKDNLKQRDRLTTFQNEQHKALLDMMEKKIESDVRHETILREVRRTLEKLSDRLE